jgi:hypothetical protein
VKDPDKTKRYVFAHHAIAHGVPHLKWPANMNKHASHSNNPTTTVHTYSCHMLLTMTNNVTPTAAVDANPTVAKVSQTTN